MQRNTRLSPISSYGLHLIRYVEVERALKFDGMLEKAVIEKQRTREDEYHSFEREG